MLPERSHRVTHAHHPPLVLEGVHLEGAWHCVMPAHECPFERAVTVRSIADFPVLTGQVPSDIAAPDHKIILGVGVEVSSPHLVPACLSVLVRPVTI
eukprot:1243849-Rhodomonas_salina.1